ncbi:hypothetical protein CLV88_105253 [Shimia abyssi]|uniref:Uncharacterized protein n=1 Tax=Shimia abyssi TaxID=1662395 RepID=A0A2P8FDS9_9RHOB|nr:hypothetical protein CLV88_105253 [Shimia abyssi]
MIDYQLVILVQADSHPEIMITYGTKSSTFIVRSAWHHGHLEKSLIQRVFGPEQTFRS